MVCKYFKCFTCVTQSVTVHNYFYPLSLFLFAPTLFYKKMSQQSGKFSTKDVDHSKQQVDKAQQKADRVTSQMASNVEAMKQQGERLDKLHGKTSELQESSSQFRSTARKAKSKAFWNYLKWLIVLLILGIGVAVFVGYKVYNHLHS